MSRFYASIQGHRGAVTRQGHKDIEGHIRGWDLGVNVRGYITESGEDAFDVSVTGGSNRNSREKFITTITGKDLD